MEPFFLPGGPIGCLLIHGFPGTPAEMRGLGEYLAQQGHTVYAVRLAGYGGLPEELRYTTWHDWLVSAEIALNELRRHCTAVVVVGFSMGGALGLLLAQRHTFARLVVLATPLALQGDWRLNILPLAKYVMPWFYPLQHADLSDPFIQARIREYAPTADLNDPQVQQHIRQSVKIPLAALDELRKLLAHTRQTLPRVSLPTLVMHGRNDDIAAPMHAEEIVARIATPAHHKTLIWWEQTGHQLLVTGPQREAMYARIATFVADQH